jgi:cell division protein FtsB
MGIGRNIFKGVKRTAVIAAILALMIVIGLSYLPVIRENAMLRRLELGKHAMVEHQRALNEELKDAVHDLQTDEKVVEAAAREKLHFARPDETVIRFVPPEDFTDDRQERR